MSNMDTQCIPLGSVENLAEEQRLSSLFERQSHPQRQASTLPPRSHVPQLRPSTNCEKLSVVVYTAAYYALSALRGAGDGAVAECPRRVAVWMAYGCASFGRCVSRYGLTPLPFGHYASTCAS